MSNLTFQKSKKDQTLSKKIRLTLLILALPILVISCAAVGKYNPDPQIASGVTSNIKITNAIKLSNSQPSKTDHALNFRGVVVNYNEFTQTLVDALKLEYERNNVTVSDTTERELEIAISEIEMFPVGMTFRANILAEVKYGDGSIERFEATRASYGSPLMVNNFPTKPLNSAFKDLVKKIIDNKNIQDYLNK